MRLKLARSPAALPFCETVTHVGAPEHLLKYEVPDLQPKQSIWAGGLCTCRNPACMPV